MSQTIDRTTSVEDRFGAFVTGLRFEDLPAATVRAAKRALFDAIGTALGGYQDEFGRRAVAFAREACAGNDASVLGGGERLTMDGAAFVNACLTKKPGMEDSHRAFGHVACQIVPAALAANEAAGQDGKHLIASIVAAYEIFGRVGRQVRQPHLAHGLDIKGTAGAIASAAAAAHGLGLDARGAAHAMGLATCLAGGLETYTHDAQDSDTEDLVSGFAARNGTFAARAARGGLRAPKGAIAGEGGFVAAYGDGVDLARLVDGLGAGFEIDTIAFKPHAGCRHVHQAVDAALAARAQGVPLEGVASIRIGTYRHALGAAFRTTLAPENPAAAEYSLPVAAATALVFGGFFPEDVARFDDPRVTALLPKIQATVDEEIQASYPRKNGCWMEVALTDGRVVRSGVEYAKGEPENMLSDAEFDAKFRKLSGDLIPRVQLDTLIDALWTVERAGAVRDLVRQAGRPGS
ncbi:MAG: MmgE/PrpD family protein [Armatimonadetes bacterium]|nr:MmgE/PrpD family protein [Armatimonadota bacterium]